ncbi:YggS family pyridoxal phosphate-dependent enzyme [Georgenia sp. MJ206]|uniref:YggS family pyridoxal phosphate-dependent enzyme n=1 Tax=Georgenia wangjunii TaxID=3117730 RepID=UPI002F268717
MSVDLSDRIAVARRRVADAAGVVGRDPGEIELLLAVKTQPVEVVRAAIAAGATLLGHNRAQELTAVEPGLADLPHATHFIGHLQSNKVAKVVPLVACVQSIDTPATAARLDRAASAAERVLDVFVQVNTSGEETKAGAAPAHAVELAEAVGRLGHLRLRGLMTIGANHPDTDVVRASYERLAALRDDVLGSRAPGTAEAHELSMGMSRDAEIAIAAGATMVRLGTSVFGERG